MFSGLVTSKWTSLSGQMDLPKLLRKSEIFLMFLDIISMKSLSCQSWRWTSPYMDVIAYLSRIQGEEETLSKG